MYIFYLYFVSSLTMCRYVDVHTNVCILSPHLKSTFICDGIHFTYHGQAMIQSWSGRTGTVIHVRRCYTLRDTCVHTNRYTRRMNVEFLKYIDKFSIILNESNWYIRYVYEPTLMRIYLSASPFLFLMHCMQFIYDRRHVNSKLHIQIHIECMYGGMNV